MAEDTLVKEQLTDEMIEAGAQLTQKLDDLGLSMPVAMWLFLPDSNEWRLIFASPQISTEGPREVYKKIEQARKALGPRFDRLPLSSIGLMDTNHQLVQVLRMALKTGPGVSRIRFSRNVVNGHFIEDALIYRSAA